MASNKFWKAGAAGVALAGLGLLLAGPAHAQKRSRHAAARGEAVVTEDLLIDGNAPGLKLFVRNKHTGTTAPAQPGRTLVFIHGASTPTEAVFDVPLDAGNTSWADHLAQRGYDVWLVDVRGYGRSGVPDAVRAAGDAGGPFASTRDAVDDLGSAIEYIAARRQVQNVHLLGWSWGTVTSSTYAGEHPQRVRSLALLGPVTPAGQPAQPAADGPRLGPWLSWSYDDAYKKLLNGVPEAEKQVILPPAQRRIWEAALLQTQPDAARRQPAQFRSPQGVAADARQHWAAGRSYYDPARITAPTLLVAGQWDALTPVAGAERLLPQLVNAWPRALVVLPRASHFVAVETGRHTFFRAYEGFIAQVDAAAADAGQRPD